MTYPSREVTRRSLSGTGTPSSRQAGHSFKLGRVRTSGVQRLLSRVERPHRELLQERAGWSPNFSPSSRFLGAYSAGPGFEIMDLYAGQVITSNDLLHRERGFRGNIHLAAWSPGDAIFALSIWGWGGIEMQQSLVDRSQRSFPDTSCHRCMGIDSQLHVDTDAGIASSQGTLESGWADLVGRSVGSAAASDYSFIQRPRQPWEDRPQNWTASQQRFSDERNQIAQNASTSMMAEIAPLRFFRPADFLGGFDPERASQHPEQNWKFPDAMALSHACLQTDNGRCVGRLVDYQDVLTGPEDQNAIVSRLIVRHKSMGTTSIPIRKGSAEGRYLSTHEANSKAERNIKPGAADQMVEGPDRVWNRLASLIPNAALSQISTGVDAKPVRQIADILKSAPGTARFLKASGPGDYIEPATISNDAYYGLVNEAQFVDSACDTSCCVGTGRKPKLLANTLAVRLRCFQPQLAISPSWRRKAHSGIGGFDASPALPGRRLKRPRQIRKDRDNRGKCDHFGIWRLAQFLRQGSVGLQQIHHSLRLLDGRLSPLGSGL